MERARIVVVGSTMTDLMAYADRLPADGETVIGTDFRSGFGGKGANQAVMASRLGADVAMVNAVGDDDLGTAILANLEHEGIDTSSVLRVSGASGVAPIWVDAAGSNRIIVIPGANLAVPPDLAARTVQERRPSVVIGQFEIPQATTTAGFVAARGLGATTVLNPAPAAVIDPELLAATDWLVPNETEFEVLTGTSLQASTEVEGERIIAFARQLGVSLVVTLGSRGAAVAPVEGGLTRVPAPSVTAVDSTGAGDAFVGGFAVGLAMGLDPVSAARLGCTTAADSVTRTGTQASYADRQRAATLLASVVG